MLQDINEHLLQNQREACLMMADYLDKRFKDVEARLTRTPNTIEEVVELEEFIAGMSLVLNSPWSSSIEDSHTQHDGNHGILYLLWQTGVGNVVAPLQEGINEMMDYNDVLDDYKLTVSDQYIRTLYGTFGWPNKLQKQVSPVVNKPVSMACIWMTITSGTCFVIINP